ncbi:hypothetical protein HPP92_028106 [Vanilla planifolia]|uniref:Uncharacterized protein n=1 Tax=Vanilla planifolia TaxID=51239 RepID=A0A835P946_VANPL|nr:hypothetical protein HPP92_028106 [Vanilla planifolia]KAG0447967.1 hypothetical protein HPP92_028083 [Vanilla planifolia]
MAAEVKPVGPSMECISNPMVPRSPPIENPSDNLRISVHCRSIGDNIERSENLRSLGESFVGSNRREMGGGEHQGHGHGGVHGPEDFRQKVWTMTGGPYCRPKHWRRNTAIALFGIFLVCIPIAKKSAELEVRHTIAHIHSSSHMNSLHPDFWIQHLICVYIRVGDFYSGYNEITIPARPSRVTD